MMATVIVTHGYGLEEGNGTMSSIREDNKSILFFFNNRAVLQRDQGLCPKFKKKNQ